MTSIIEEIVTEPRERKLYESFPVTGSVGPCIVDLGGWYDTLSKRRLKATVGDIVIGT